MAYILITADTINASPRYFPVDTAIDQAMNPTPGRVGPARIVRRRVGNKVVTYATILVQLQPGAGTAVFNELAHGVERRLYEFTLPPRASDIFDVQEVANLWQVSVGYYDPAVNGSVDWWANTASQTNQRNTDAPDNSAAATSPPPSALERMNVPGPTFQAYVLKENSFLGECAPRFESLRNIFRGVTLAPGLRWLGPDPRVTRFRRPPRNETYAVWVMYFPDRTRSFVQAESIRNQLDRLASAAPGVCTSHFDFEPVTQMDIDTRFGPPEFWMNGSAARTHTAFDFGNYFLQTPENPYGPDDPALRPTTLIDWTDAAMHQAPSILWPLAAILAIGAGLYMMGPAARAASQQYAFELEEKRKLPRANPRRTRSKRGRR